METTALTMRERIVRCLELNGPATQSEIAIRLGVPRWKIYSALQQLVIAGEISEKTKGRAKVFRIRRSVSAR